MMIERLFKPLRIGKSLLSFLAMFMMLLAPQGAWAQTDYGLTVAGVAVTSANASNVLNDQETPTVVFTPATGGTAATLTLNGANFTGCVQRTNSDPLIVNFVGTSIITLESEGYAFVGNGGVLTFMTTSSTPLLVRNTFGSKITSGWAQGSTEVAWDDENATWYLKQTQTSYELTLYKNAETYNLTVARVAVTEANASDVLGDGKVSYDSKTNILTLNGATIAPQGEAPGIDYTGTDDLTISFSGTNSITGASGCSAIRYNGTSQTPPTLTFESSSASSTLTLTETSSSVIRYFSSVLGVNGINNATGRMLALTGGNVSYDAENGLYTGDDQNTVPVTSATITSGYGLAVGGVVVFADNASHILGDNNTTVTFNASNNILTLNGANFTGNIRWISANTLTVEILGNNNIDADYSTFFEGNSNANLILTTNSDNPGDLLLTRCYSYNVMSGWNNNNSVFYNKESSSGAATDYGWWADAISDQTKLRLNKVYDLWVDNVQLCDAQNEVSFDPDNYSGNRITYEDGKLKFQTVSKTTANSPFIVNGLGDLTILLVGNNTLNCGALFLGKKTGDTDDHKVTFTTKDNGSLVITTTGGENAWYTGHNAPTYEGLALVDEMKNNVRTLTISEPISYNLEVAGVPVTSANATNITGDYITGTVSFDASNNTLTLDGATIDLTEMEGPGISYTGTANLTIKLVGTNSIKTQSGCEPIIYDVYPAPTQIPTLTFESGSFPCSLSLQGVNSTVIKYFGGVQGVNGINSAEGNYLTISNSEVEVKYDPANSTNGLYTGDNTAVTSVTISSVSLESVAPTINRMAMQDADGIKLILSSGINNGTIKYSVDYVDENETDITDATYDDTNRPTISKPATVTAYISVNNETSATATAKYFGFTEPMTVVYEGTPVELTNLPTLVPATEGLTYEIGEISNAAIISYDEQTEKYRAEGYGTAILTVNIPENVYPLNDGCETTLTVNVVPPAPTIGLDEGEVLNTATITLTTTINGATIKYKWDNGTEETYSEAIPVQAGTLKAWVEVSSVVSDVVEATYSLITDISTLYFAAIDDIPYTGSAVTPTIVVKETEDAETPLTLGTDYTVSYKKEETSITAADLVNRGNYTVVISGTGNYGGTKELKFSITTGIATITAENQTAEYTGDQIVFDKNAITLTPNTLSKDGLSFNYYTPNPDNPEEPNMLEVAPTNVGTYIVEISFEDDNYAAEPVTKTLTISPKSITSDMITLSESSFEYNGEKQVPTVTVKDGEVTLVGDDYDVSYQKVDGQTTTDGVSPTDAGTYYVKVTGKGNYSGAATKSFTIAPASIAGYTVTVDATQTYTYTGSAITPSVTVTIPNVGALDAANYTVSYENNVNAADENATIKPTVTVTGKDNYTGTASATFTIDKATIQGIEVSIPDELTYNGTKQNLISVTLPENVVGAKVKYYYQSVLEQDYNGSFDLNCAAMYTFTETVPAETNAGYFLMLYKVEGGDNYKDIAPAATQRNDIAPATVTKVTLNPTSLTYTGSDQTVSITSVKAGSLTLGTSDYTVKLDNETVTTIKAKNTGTYTVEVTGQGNFTGSETATFTIMNKTLDVAQNDFHNHWMTYYSDNGDIDIPANSNIGAYVATGVTGNAVTVTQISYIPEKVAVLLNNETTETPDNTNVTNNMLRHADEDVVVPEGSVIYYGLYNGKMKRVHGTISAGKNYLLIPIQSAPELTIVVDGETTGISEIETMRNVDNENVYDLMGRKVQKPSKNGLYISKGHKVVINK